MTKIDELRDKYDEYLRLGKTTKATEVLQKVNNLESDNEPDNSEEEVSFEELDGVGSELANTLSDNYDSMDELAEADPEDLEPIPGIGDKRAASIIEQASE